jgi:hypothetical protein
MSSKSVETTGLDLEGMTKAQLIEYGQGIGIELNMRMTKTEMLETLREEIK